MRCQAKLGGGGLWPFDCRASFEDLQCWGASRRSLPVWYMRGAAQVGGWVGRLDFIRAGSMAATTTARAPPHQTAGPPLHRQAWHAPGTVSSCLPGSCSTSSPPSCCFLVCRTIVSPWVVGGERERWLMVDNYGGNGRVRSRQSHGPTSQPLPITHLHTTPPGPRPATRPPTTSGLTRAYTSAGHPAPKLLP